MQYEYVLIGRDSDDQSMPDSTSIIVDVHAVDSGRVMFDIQGDPFTLRLFSHLQGLPCTEDDPHEEHTLFDQYLVCKTTEDTPVKDPQILYRFRFTTLDNGAVSVEYGSENVFPDDIWAGARTILNMISKDKEANQ